LNCNKIKKLGVNKVEDLASLMADSKHLELDSGKTKIRRKGNKAVPELFKTSKK